METRPFDLYLILDLGLGDGVTLGEPLSWVRIMRAGAIIVTMIRPGSIRCSLDLDKVSAPSLSGLWWRGRPRSRMPQCGPITPSPAR
jgi:hypothetical protein